MKSLIAICDDEPESVHRWETRLASLEEVRTQFKIIGRDDFQKEIVELEQRRSQARAGAPGSIAETFIDEADILIVDFDLLRLNTESYLTGEMVAYLARCYSSCGVIVVLNQFGENPFDLTLRGHPESFADLNLGAVQVANPGLWGAPTNGFRPWVWPILPDLLQQFRQRADALSSGGLDQKIHETIGLSPAVMALLPRSAREFVEGETPLEELTFREYLTSAGTALKRKDEMIDDTFAARVAAARIAKWCTRVLLPPQDVVVDGPHLVLRYPSLLGTPVNSYEDLDRVADLRPGRAWTPENQSVAQFRPTTDIWFGRPVWFGRGVSGCTDVPEVADPWSIKEVDAVFCEDLSRFARRNAAREFVAELESPHVRRHVADPLAEEMASIRDELQAVTYQPSVRFSL